MVPALAALVCAATVPGAWGAAGVEPGVHAAAASPAEKEYALPLNQARHTGSKPSAQGGSEPQLFGEGVTPPTAGVGAAAANRPRSTRAAHPRRRHVAGAPSETALPSGSSVPPPAVTHAPQASSGGGSTVALLAGAVAVLVLGGFAGTMLRHRR